jgi:hypothetical protein
MKRPDAEFIGIFALVFAGTDAADFTTSLEIKARKPESNQRL